MPCPTCQDDPERALLEDMEELSGKASLNVSHRNALPRGTKKKKVMQHLASWDGRGAQSDLGASDPPRTQ